MPQSGDSRKHPRIKVRVPNSLRVKVKEGDCLADLLDISHGGAGIEFFDLFEVLIFTEGDLVKLEFLLKPEQVNNENASKILVSISKHNKDLEDAQGKSQSVDSTEQSFEADAKIAWTYLNRLGLEFIDQNGNLPSDQS